MDGAVLRNSNEIFSTNTESSQSFITFWFIPFASLRNAVFKYVKFTLRINAVNV